MAERLINVPRNTSAGVSQSLQVLLVKDCALSDLDELWIDLPLVGTRIIVDHDTHGVREYRLVFNSSISPAANAVAITGHTGYYWVPVVGDVQNVIIPVTGRTLLASETGSLIATVGNAGTLVVNLPAAVPGLVFEFVVMTAFALQIEPSSGQTIGLPSTGVQEAANDFISADAVNEYVKLVCISAGTWTPVNFLGTWTGQ